MNTEACVDQAIACIERANRDPGRKDYWLTQAAEWMLRSVDAAGKEPRKSLKLQADMKAKK